MKILRTNHLNVWFYNPDTDPSGLVNKLVAHCDGPFCHCEIQLADGMAASIYMHGTASMRLRKFSNPAYTCVRIPCHYSTHARAADAMKTLVASEPEFSSRAMLGAYYGVNWCAEKHTFCSKLVADVLHAARLFPEHIDTATITPSGLHRLLTNASSPTHNTAPQACASGRVEAIGFKT